MKRLILLPGLFTIILLIASCGTTSTNFAPEEVGLSGDTLELVSREMQAFIDSGALAGMIVRTIKDGKVAHSECFGFSDIERQTPMKEDDIFRIFSMTKPIVAAALMTLYEDGKFKLDDPLYMYIPWFRDTKVYSKDEGTVTLVEQENPITIRHLLTHTSGLTYGGNPGHYVDSMYVASGVTTIEEPLADAIKKLASLPLKYQPGTRYEYGLSLDVAGYLIEVLSGEPLDLFLKNTIFDPLKMDDTGFQVPAGKYNRLTTLYTRDKDKRRVVFPVAKGIDMNERFRQPAIYLSGGAGLVSTIGDYERFCRMLINGGELGGVRILEEPTVDLIMTNQLPGGVSYVEGKIGYGLGGSVNLTTGQYGWAGAASTTFTIYPEQGMICLCFSQLFPSDNTYSNIYRSIVKRAIIP